MIIFPSRELLDSLVCHQLNNLFILDVFERDLIVSCVDVVLPKVEYCFSFSKNKYYRSDADVFFSIYHSGQYSVFLYFLSREIFLSGAAPRTLADKIYYLNKSLNGLDLYYEVEMPRVFHLDHPVGSVLGRAVYGENFTFSQNCTVGNNKGVFPVIGNGVCMHSGSKVIGACNVGEGAVLSANSYVKDEDVPAFSIVFGSSPSLFFKSRKS